MTRPDDASPKNARRVGQKCSGPSLHDRTGTTKSAWCVRLRESRPCGWEATAFCHRDSPQRPIHKKDTTRDCCRAPHLHHILCSAHTNTCATARGVPCVPPPRVPTPCVPPPFVPLPRVPLPRFPLFFLLSSFHLAALVIIEAFLAHCSKSFSV